MKADIAYIEMRKGYTSWQSSSTRGNNADALKLSEGNFECRGY